MTSHAMDSVIIGNLTLNAKVLREALKKSCYILSYDQVGTITLSINHRTGAKTILEIRNTSYENAARMAQELGFKESSKTLWTKWNPILKLGHDSSSAADELMIELLRSGIPCVISKSTELTLTNDQGIHRVPAYSKESLIQIVQDMAKRYAEELSTTP